MDKGGQLLDLLREIRAEEEDAMTVKELKRKGSPITRQTETGTEKRCSKCHNYYPMDLDHFYNDSSSGTRFTSQCIACQSDKTWEEIHGEKEPEKPIKPADFMTDPQGRMVPIALVKPLDKTRDELVRKLVADAQAVRDELKAFKSVAMDEINGLVELAAMEWEVSLGGNKGNLTLHSYDHLLRINVQNSETLAFDEQLQAAKTMIDQCLNKWTQESGDEIKAIINDAFQVDKKGRINTMRILGLRKLDIKDALWIKAMDAITASLKVVGSRQYLRLYRRKDNQSTWQPISLDIAGI